MDDKNGHQDVKKEIERKHFVRAALIAASISLHKEELQDLQSKALHQMSALYRNVQGTKILAKQFGFSNDKLRHVLGQYAREKRKEGNSKPLDPCYDYKTGKYLSFEEWMNHYFNK